jgi:3-deoxy-7-phosphoheptulonate synthase
VHDPAGALDYATRLSALKTRYADDLLVVMRVYFEKPRTRTGWKGLINDPHFDGSCDVRAGLEIARKLLLDLSELGIPAATEMLDPIVPQYTADLISWAAIGARTTESQTHREMASGLSMPVGFKNATDGDLEVAINAMIAASRQHSFVGIDGGGRVGVVQTAGNPDCHLVLRGGHGGPNYGPEHVGAAGAALARAGVCARALVDTSHDNCGKNHARQPEVLDSVADQITNGSTHLLGVMVESNLVAGRQDLIERSKLVYGQSITDPCVDFETTETMLDRLALAARTRARVSTPADAAPRRNAAGAPA